MDEMESTVAVDEAIATEAPADDALAAEISAEELMGNLTGGAPSGEQAEISGDGGDHPFVPGPGTAEETIGGVAG